MSYIEKEIKNSVLILSLDKPNEKVNTLDESLMDQFNDLLHEVDSNNELKGIVIISKKKDNFIAGADIEMFKARSNAEEMQQLSWNGHHILNKIEQSKKPVVVAIHGSCMGGGLELSMACHYQIGSNHPKTVLALPEVKLGVIPGTGGTQRLPRLIGIQKALSYMLTGRNIFAKSAKKIGLIDELTHKDALEDAAIKAVHKIWNNGTIKRKDTRTFCKKFLKEIPSVELSFFTKPEKKLLAKPKEIIQLPFIS